MRPFPIRKDRSPDWGGIDPIITHPHERERYRQHVHLNAELRRAANVNESHHYETILVIETIAQRRENWWHVPQQRSQTEIGRKFQGLATQWKRDTEHLSSMTKMILHRAYQQIIGLGPAAIKFILQELQEHPDYWFWALESISGKNPVQPEDDFDGAVRAWLNWGKREGYI